MERIFNVSVNGISGVIEIPTGFYVGSTLAEALESRINQIQDPVTGDTVGVLLFAIIQQTTTLPLQQEQRATPPRLR